MSKYLMKQLNVMSVAKVGAILGLVWGLIEGIILALVIIAMSPFARAVHPLLTALGAGVVFRICHSNRADRRIHRRGDLGIYL